MKKLENIVYKAFCLLAMLFVMNNMALAQAGEKYASISVYADHNDSTDNLIHADSIEVDVDIDSEVEVDDTLVFEDWEEARNKREWEDSSTLELDCTAFYCVSDDDNEESANHKEQAPVKNRWNTALDIQVTLYPNPTVNALNIRADVAPSNIRIVDIVGKEYIRSDFTNEVNVTELPVGTYVIQLIYEGHVESRKFIKH